MCLDIKCQLLLLTTDTKQWGLTPYRQTITMLMWCDMSCHDNSDTVMTDGYGRNQKKKWQGGHRGASYMRRGDTTWERECRQGKPIISPHMYQLLAKNLCFCLFVWHSQAPLYTLTLTITDDGTICKCTLTGDVETIPCYLSCWQACETVRRDSGEPFRQ